MQDILVSTQYKIKRNMCKCLCCNDVLVSTSASITESCYCGALDISGGTEKIVRVHNGTEFIEELTEWSVV